MDKNSIAISHTFFPESSLLSQFLSYQVRLSEPTGFLAALGMNRVMVTNNSVVIGGYKKVENRAEFILYIVIDGLQYAENKRMTYTSTDKPPKTSYSQKIIFYVPITVRILNASQQNIITLEIRNSRNVHEWNSNLYFSSKELDQNLDIEKRQLTELVKKYLETAFAEISTQLTKKYGFREEKDWVTFYELDSPHPKFTNYKKQTDLIERELPSYKSGMNVKDARQRMQPALDYFTQLVSTLNKGDKQQRKLLKHTLINLFQLHFYLDDYENFKKYGDLYTRLEQDGEWKDNRLTIPEKMYKSMKACGATSLYFVRYLTEAKLQVETSSNSEKEEVKVTEKTEVKSATQEIDLSRLKLRPTDRVLNGVYIDKNHQSTTGYFVLSTGDDNLLIFDGGAPNANFVYLDSEGNPRRKPIEPKKVDSFNIDTRQFVVMDYKAPGSIGGKSACIMEVLADYPSIRLYKYYPSAGGLGFDEDYAFVFVKPDQSIISFTGKDMFWKKKARNYFAPCKSILDEIDNLKITSPNKNISIRWAEMFAKRSH